MKNLRYEIALAGLLHDIGKLYQRTEKAELYKRDSSKHPEITENFIRKYKDVFLQVLSEKELDFIIECAKRHHSNESFDKAFQPQYANEEYKRYCYLIAKADDYASVERGKKVPYQKKELLALVPVLASDNHFVYDLLTKEIGYHRAETKVYWKDSDYLKLIQEFEQAFSGIQASTKEELFDTILDIFKQYLRSVPSACNVNVPVISLYTHLRATSAIASALYNTVTGSYSYLMLYSSLDARVIINDLNLTTANILLDAKYEKCILIPDDIIPYLKKRLVNKDFIISKTIIVKEQRIKETHVRIKGLDFNRYICKTLELLDVLDYFFKCNNRLTMTTVEVEEKEVCNLQKEFSKYTFSKYSLRYYPKDLVEKLMYCSNKYKRVIDNKEFYYLEVFHYLKEDLEKYNNLDVDFLKELEYNINRVLKYEEKNKYFYYLEEKLNEIVFR